MLIALLGLSLAQVPCLDDAIALLKHDPNGLAVLEAHGDREGFGYWLDCGSVDYDVSSAVHETVHLLSHAESQGDYSWYLVGGERITVPWSKSPPRSNVVRDLRKDERDSYVDTYLTGASGEQGLELLLDELNAYTHGLITEIALAPRHEGENRRTAARDGVAHFQLYLVIYLAQLRADHPKRHAKLAETLGPVTAALWKQSEKALRASLPYDSLGIDDRWYLHRAWKPAMLEELDHFTGGRTWSSSLRKRLTANPPKGPTPPSSLKGETTERTQQQRQARATMTIGADAYIYEELWPSGVLKLTVNGERQPVKTWGCWTCTS